MCYRGGMPYLNILSNDVEDGESPVPCNDVSEFPGPSAPVVLKEAGTQQAGEGVHLKDSAKPLDTDFLEGMFININSAKQKTTRNKKNSKKKGKGKGGKGKGKKGKGTRKQSHASELKSDASPTKPSSTCADAAANEAMVSSSSPVAAALPLLEYSSPLSSAISGASPEKELSDSSSNDDFDFKSFDSTTSYYIASSSSVNGYYTGGNNAWNNTMGDYAGSLSDPRSERPLSASECTDSRDFKKRSDEGSKPNDHQSSSLPISPGGSQEESLCRDDASNGGDFQKVISRKAAQKMKKMQHMGSPTMAASGPLITRSLVPRAPRGEVITIGHYVKDDFSNGRKPNHKVKGKIQKGPSLSEVSKTGYTDGQNVPDSSRMLLMTVHTGKPESSQMALCSTSRRHVTQEDIEETSSQGCLPMEGELKAPVGGDTESTNSTAPSSHITSPLGNLPNFSCVDSQEQGKSMALVAVGGDTESTDSIATSSDKTSSLLSHPSDSSCVDRGKQKKGMALVGGDTIHTDYTTSSSSDDHLVNYSCAMAPVGGDGDTKDTTSISDKTWSSLGHLSNSSREREEQTKQKNERSFIASHELDKIIKAANDAYKIQAASDAYEIYGVHADIETFLPAATPVIAQIACTTNNINLKDHYLWNVWRCYEEPGCCGIEVEIQGSINSSWANSSTYFVPSLSAVQLFGQSGNEFSTPEEPCLLSQNHGGLLFEYFESEKPFLRPPLFTKIKQLLNGVDLSPIFGDPKLLKSVKLSDLHPASWFSVSWYPICQIPAASRSRQEAAFLTYHSLGKLVPQTCPYKAGLYSIICPVVGLLGYRDKGEKWYQLGEQSWSKPTPKDSWKTHAAELLNKKMRALRHCASIMSKAVVPRAPGEAAMNNHPDYKFFS